MKLRKGIKSAIIVLLSIALSLCLFEMIYPRVAHKMEYQRAPYRISIDYEEVDYGYTKKQIRKKLEQLVGASGYWCIEKDLEPGTSGVTQLMFRVVVIEKDLSTNEYIEVMCHELLHIKYNTVNERFIQYQTFLHLYNSEFKQIALNIAHKMQYGNYPYEYECYAQIVEYLEHKSN